MDRSRRPWASHRGRDDKKRDNRDEFDDFLEKKKRELADLKADADRLRADRNKSRAEIDRLRAELHSKDAAIGDLEQALRDTSRDTQDQLIKRFKAAFEEVLGPPAVNEGDATDPSEEGAVDHDPAPTLPEDTTGPGDAAPAPEREEDEIQEQALERAAHSSEMPPAPGGQ